MTTPGGLPADDLRALVREALRDVLPELLGAAAGAAPGTAPRVEHVRVRDDADLAAFAARVLAAADDVRSGRLAFRLADGAAPPASASSGGTGAVPTAGPTDHVVARGAVTERHVRAAERAGGRLVLGPRAVLTPLARDRARTAGVEIVRLRPTDRTDPAAPGRSS